MSGDLPSACPALRTIYWHRELPPLGGDLAGEYVVEATSNHVPDTIAGREALWARGKDELMANARTRLNDEITRLGGRFAHVVRESIETRHDPGKGEAWLRGVFTFMLYR
jgi:hypothetical protein